MDIPHILHVLQLDALNPMQEEMLAVTKKHGKVVLQAPTGSGKTLAFLLPLFRNLQANQDHVQALVIAPSRELALQITAVARSLKTPHKVNCFYGGHPFKTERNNLSSPPALIVATPGRLADHLRRETFDTAGIRTLVLDEFDKALELGFEKDMQFILEQLPSLEHRYLISATGNTNLPDFTGMKAAQLLRFEGEKATSGDLTLKYIRAAEQDKLDVLLHWLQAHGTAPSLVFCNHREAVERISDHLKEAGFAHAAFHGGLDQEARERALIRFRNESIRVLLCTDLAARGIDIPTLKHVVHYQLPLKADAYIHRNGRTARMFADGTAWLFLSATEKLPDYIDTPPAESNLDIEAGNGHEKFSISKKGEDTPAMPSTVSFVPPAPPRFQTLYIGGGKKEKVSKGDIVGFLIQKGGLQSDEIGRIEIQDHTAYAAIPRKKFRKVLQTIRHQKIKGKKIKFDRCR